ncbi:ATP-dependent metalloprotease FtsH [Planctopirus limnophila DSM 3776]|uniref:ATP-dependent zinc metalloprotease FtsH n=1 Tax=Planctopirus limnophila (strain ATCC 43296 / DSM 3776 / IFAM 1008 / Mu 290) TaxID=521674 RepID=D5SWV5_PLAL2|nr:ATP-dependent zinc metalloprotease FtsH [Planctopirus limnophila]ADG67455.1 ATP-dependent metalloprotease FtsH [Planctopirus limnophila DSM 3776]
MAPLPKDSPPPPAPRLPSNRETDDEPKKSSFPASWVILILILTIGFVWMWQASPSNQGKRVDYIFVWRQAEEGKIAKVTYHGELLTGTWKNEKGTVDPEDPDKIIPANFNTILPLKQDDDLLRLLREKGVKISAEPQDPGLGMTLLLWLSGPLLILGVFYYMMRRNTDAMGGGGMMGNFIRSPAKKFKASEQMTTFADVAAMEQAKGELAEIVEFLKSPQKFQKLGAQIPKGVLLMGPPGTGKTLLARATAGEAGVPFYSINGSEFIQMFVGVGASRVRDLFRNAKENSPCILFIDEIDAVGRVRGAGLGGGHDEREQTLNQILSEMDGFNQTEAVIVIAATNRPDVLDPALLRPGRFDRHISVDRSNKTGREAILKVHCRKVPLADDVDLAAIASSTIGFSGAELKNLVNEAALGAARDGRDKVTKGDFDLARDRVLMGAKREEVLSPHEREMTAYHEAGHALLAWFQPELDPVHKVTIIPRGRALGVTQLLPNEERYNIGEKRIHAQLVFMLGGRAAEKLVFDEYSAGAEDDLKRATQLTRRMVSHWGMSEVIGPVAFRSGEEHPFLGKEMSEPREHSEATAHLIDQEVQRILVEAANKARQMLVDHREALDKLSMELVKAEALDYDQMVGIIGEPIPRTEHTLVSNA